MGTKLKLCSLNGLLNDVLINVLAGKAAWLIEPLFRNDTFFKLKQPPDMSSEFSVRVVTCFLPVRQFITLHNLVWTFESFDYAIEMKATGQFFPVVLFIMLH